MSWSKFRPFVQKIVITNTMQLFLLTTPLLFFYRENFKLLRAENLMNSTGDLEYWKKPFFAYILDLENNF